MWLSAEIAFAQGAGDYSVANLDEVNKVSVSAGRSDLRKAPLTKPHGLGGRSVTASVGGAPKVEPAYELKMYGGQLVRVAPWRSKPALTIEGCWDGPVELMECRIIPEDEPSEGSEDAAPGKRASRGQVERVVRSLVSRLELPVPVPSVGPDPHANEWGMAVVGYPLWLWTDNPAEVSSTVSGEGITIAIVARRGVTSFAMGDGGRVECGRMTPYSASVKPGAKSPTCGYVYGQPSLPRGAYTVSASSRWVVEWSALGFQGSLPVTVTGERELRVGELHALVVR